MPDELMDIKKPIIGYYGAMADWLDTELLYRLASARPNWNFILIGRIEGADVSRLETLNNVFLFGEKPYELLPVYLEHFDTCIIPFKKIPLTEATNPVKLFEFLSAGKSVVATDLHELRYYQEYVRLVSTDNEWLHAIELALADYLPLQVTKRIRFARQNTWEERMLLIEDALQSMSQNQVNLSVPLPEILPRENLVSAKLLTQHEGIDYWCLLYEKDGIIHKQTSLDLAEREARFLSQFDGDYFPRPLSVHSEAEYSVITLKKIQGRKLRDALADINSSAIELYNFIQHCLNILLDLEKKGITHRNICRENILVQDGKPVLLDFTWAILKQEPYFSPSGLGGYERPPDGHFSDVYSMGKILKYINRQHYRAFDWVISLMTIADMRLRIIDLMTLKTLFATALEITLEDVDEQVNYA
jgi:tRNA A-37 threonylcarbamoyl transferase component Bud32